MRYIIATGLAVAVFGFASAVLSAPLDVKFRAQTPPLATPVPKNQVAECRFYPCNCHQECVIYEGDRCVRSVRSCDTCSDCKD